MVITIDTRFDMSGLLLKKYAANVPIHFLGVHNRYAERTEIMDIIMLLWNLKCINNTKGR